jgi:hypothetical protein
MSKRARKYLCDQAEAVGAPPPLDIDLVPRRALDPRQAHGPLLPVYCSIDTWKHLTGMSRRAIYEALGRGELMAIKRGTQTLVDCDHGFAWLRSLPRAVIKPRHPPENQKHVTP